MQAYLEMHGNRHIFPVFKKKKLDASSKNKFTCHNLLHTFSYVNNYDIEITSVMQHMEVRTHQLKSKEEDEKDPTGKH